MPLLTRDLETDLLVAGGGMAGVCAALAGNGEKAQTHIDEACVSLCALERELARIGAQQ